MFCPICHRSVQANHATEPCPMCGFQDGLLSVRPVAQSPSRTRTPARRKRTPTLPYRPKRAK